MANRIVLISDDSNFFDFIRSKLELRKSDELFTFNFDEMPDKIHLLTSAVLIINSEGANDKTLTLLKLINGVPSIVCSYNEDEVFRRKCYRAGVYDYMPLLIPDAEFRARMIPILNAASILEKNEMYRNILVKNKVITKNNEVFIDYNLIIDSKLEELSNSSKKAVFGAIAPNDKTKFLMQANTIETILLNNIRKNDVLMTFSPNKYFIFMLDTDINSVEKLWKKISPQFSQKIYAGFVTVSKQKSRQLIDAALNKLYSAMNNDKNVVEQPVVVDNLSQSRNQISPYTNFKLFKQEFGKKIEQVITPAFYQVQQKYSGKLTGVNFEQGSGDGYGVFYIKGKYSTSCFRVTSPGFSKINIDITYQKDNSNVDAKRISLEPEELETGLLEDLLEQFINEYKTREDV